jgi:hypothetical protein
MNSALSVSIEVIQLDSGDLNASLNINRAQAKHFQFPVNEGSSRVWNEKYVAVCLFTLVWL